MGDGEEAGFTRIVSSPWMPYSPRRLTANAASRSKSLPAKGFLGHTFEHLAKIIERSKFQEGS